MFGKRRGEGETLAVAAAFSIGPPQPQSLLNSYMTISHVINRQDFHTANGSAAYVCTASSSSSTSRAQKQTNPPTPYVPPLALARALIGCARMITEGVLVYDTETLSSAAFGAAAAAAAAATSGQQQQDSASSGPVPARADVALGGRPSCMAVSEDNLRVAVAVGDKVRRIGTAVALLCRAWGEAGTRARGGLRQTVLTTSSQSAPITLK